MSLQIAPLNKDIHAKTKVDVEQAFVHIQNEHFVPVAAHEFSRLGSEVPVVFLKNPTTEAFEAIAMLSFKQGSNLMIKDGKWQGFYVPKAFRNFPLGLVHHPDNPEQVFIGLVTNSPMVSEERGVALFTEEGEQSDFLKHRTEAMGEFIRQMEQTKLFNSTLAAFDLLVPQTLSIDLNGTKQELSGFYVVDEAKLNALDAEKFADLRQRGMLAAIYAHLMSLQQVQRLGSLVQNSASSESSAA